MTSGAQDREGQLVEVGRGFPSILLSSWALRWGVSETVLGAAIPGDGLFAC
jgi:hypothetical protein